MKLLISKTISFFILLSLTVSVNAPGLNQDRIATLETALESYMQLTQTEIALQLPKMESISQHTHSALEQTISGIFFHEAAMKFTDKTLVAGYAKKSYETLTQLAENPNTEAEIMPFVTAFQGSAQVLFGEATDSKLEIRKGFKVLNASVENYHKYSFISRYLRGTTFERLSLSKSIARKDFTLLITDYENNQNFACGNRFARF